MGLQLLTAQLGKLHESYEQRRLTLCGYIYNRNANYPATKSPASQPGDGAPCAPMIAFVPTIHLTAFTMLHQEPDTKGLSIFLKHDSLPN